ncbi:MAG: exodeoxyribonuclease III [Gammaproteobacteria bacterium]|nr:exodeoxyribonuclease III [Gammaproteobacteria bacterium]
MNIISFNINSVRARIHQVKAIVDNYHPAVIGLQETKVQDSEFPHSQLAELGYEIITHGQKGHYGVALMTNLPVLDTYKGLPDDTEDSQKRLVGARLALPNGSDMTVYNGYFPQGESLDHPTKFPAKRAFYQGLQDLLEHRHTADEQMVIMGDMNISATDTDIGIGEDNRKRWLRTGKTSFQPEEREWMQRLLDYGLQDSYRELYPQGKEYSWFDYRSKGFERDPRRGLRIDQILLTSSLMQYCPSAGIDYQIRGMEKPSDHCPIWAKLDLP